MKAEEKRKLSIFGLVVIYSLYMMAKKFLFPMESIHPVQLKLSIGLILFFLIVGIPGFIFHRRLAEYFYKEPKLQEKMSLEFMKYSILLPSIMGIFVGFSLLGWLIMLKVKGIF